LGKRREILLLGECGKLSDKTATEMALFGAVLILIAILNLFPVGALFVSLILGLLGAFAIKMAIGESKKGLYG
jgi:hypothetical protein